jgi:oligopeptidase A
MANPFLTKDFQIRWSTLTPDHVVPDIQLALERVTKNLDTYAGQDRGRWSFDTVIFGLEEATRELDQAWGLVEHLMSVCNSPELREAHGQMLPKVSAFRAKIPLNESLWDLIETYSKTESARALTGMRARALNETVAYFRNHGAELPPDKKKRLEALECL